MFSNCTRAFSSQGISTLRADFFANSASREDFEGVADRAWSPNPAGCEDSEEVASRHWSPQVLAGPVENRLTDPVDPVTMLIPKYDHHDDVQRHENNCPFRSCSGRPKLKPKQTNKKNLKTSPKWKSGP